MNNADSSARRAVFVITPTKVLCSTALASFVCVLLHAAPLAVHLHTPQIRVAQLGANPMHTAQLAIPPPVHLRPAIFSPGSLPVKKPCHSVRSGALLIRSTPDLKAIPVIRRVQADPLYLFCCSRKWHKFGDTESGWELLQAMRSQPRGSRALAAELLAGTENGKLLVRDLRRTRRGLNQVNHRDDELQDQNAGEAESMNTPYGLQMVENCGTCHLRKPGWYCSLTPDLLKSFIAFSHLTTYPGGAVLFVEGQTPRGGFVLCSGKVKLSTTSREGKVLVLKIVQPGEMMGLSAAISGEAYEITAETLGPCLVNFVERDGLLRLMERSGELGLRSALAVSREFQSAYRDIQELVLAKSSSGKLARLLLSWMERAGDANQEVRIQAPVTHEEMAQRIGASRETVTRLLSDLRKKDFIKLEGSTLVIKNRPAIEAMAV